MKKLSFVLALVLILGALGSMFAVGAAEEATRYDMVEIYRGYSDTATWGTSYGVLNSLATPGDGMLLQLTNDDFRSAALGTLSGISGFMIDFGSVNKMNVLYYSDCTVTAKDHANGDIATYWYSTDGVNFTQITEFDLEVVGESYQYREEARTEDQKYATPFRVIFPEVEARYLMIGVDNTTNGAFTLAYLKDTGDYANGNVYALYDAEAKVTPKASVGAVATVVGVLLADGETD